MAVQINKIVIGSLCILLAIFIFANISFSRKVEKYKLLYNNQVALNDTLKKESESVYQKLAMEYENDKKIMNQLKQTNRDLYKSIKKNKEEISSLTSLVIKWKNMYIEATAQETTYVDSGGNQVIKVSFDQKCGPVRVFGSTVTPPPKVDIRLSMEPIGLKVVITQIPGNQWNSRLEISDNYKDYLVADRVDVDVNPIEQNSDSYVLGFGYGYPYGLKANIGYKWKNHIGLIAFGKGMAGADYMYLFRKRK